MRGSRQESITKETHNRSRALTACSMGREKKEKYTAGRPRQKERKLSFN